MTKVRVHHDGWLALPAAVREKLGLSTGNQLELELVDSSIVLRPVRSGTAAAAPAPVAMAEPSVSATPPAAAAAAPMVKRGPGRPRKTPLPVVPPTLKARGGKRKAAATAEPRQ
jgi:AbrB family looped-hinge helix DNA binding protein